jgi:hypothetical protein
MPELPMPQNGRVIGVFAPAIRPRIGADWIIGRHGIGRSGKIKVRSTMRKTRSLCFSGYRG